MIPPLPRQHATCGDDRNDHGGPPNQNHSDDRRLGMAELDHRRPRSVVQEVPGEVLRIEVFEREQDSRAIFHAEQAVDAVRPPNAHAAVA